LVSKAKLWEAVECLVGAGSVQQRLSAASRPLIELARLQKGQFEGLPEGVRRDIASIVNALTAQPPDGHGDGVVAASVRNLTPAQRERIARDILEIFAELHGGL
jgi:hypothetical protein